MAIKVSGTTVIDDSRNVTDVESVGDSNTVYTGNGYNLSGIEHGVSNFVASGAIPDGRAVILNSDGTVSIPTKTVTEPISFGSTSIFNSSDTSDISAVYDPDNKKVIVVYDGTVIVGTVSGNSISFGTPDTTSIGNYPSIAYDSNSNRVVVAYRDSSSPNYGKAVVGEVDGTTINFGTPVTFNEDSTSTGRTALTFDSRNNKIVIGYTVTASNSGRAIVGTVDTSNNTDTITFGSAVVLASGDAPIIRISATFDPSNSVVVFLYTYNSGLWSIAGAVSGNSINFGSHVSVESSSGNISHSLTFDSLNSKVVIAYRDQSNYDYGTAVVGTVSGIDTSISYGSEVLFNRNGTYDPSLTYIGNGKVFLSYYDGDASTNSGLGAKASIGTVNGNLIDISPGQIFESNEITDISSVYDSTNDKVVCFYNDEDNLDGTAVVFDPGDDATTFSSPIEFAQAQDGEVSATFDSNSNKLVVAYRDGASGPGKAVVGTISDNSISFGTPVQFNSGHTHDMSLVFDSSNNKVVIVYRDGGNSDYGTAIVGTVSGTSISFNGSATTLPLNGGNDQVYQNLSSTFDSTNGRVVVCFENNGDGKASVGEVSGNTISFGAVAEFNNSSGTRYISPIFDSTNGKLVIAYKDLDSNIGRAIVGTVSGNNNTIAFGNHSTFSGGADYISAAYDSSNDKVVIAYSEAGKAIVGTVNTSNNTIGFGNTVSFNPAKNYASSYDAWSNMAFDSTDNKVVLAYRDNNANSYEGSVIVGTVSGVSTSISFNSEYIFDRNDIKYPTVVPVPAPNSSVVVYFDVDDNVVKAFVVNNSKTNLTAENYIGIAAEAISDGATGKINIAGGVNSSQTGLTTSRTYYVQKSGDVGLTSSIPDVVAGTSISSTQIIVR